MSSKKSEKITVVGSGLVGRCWAIVFSRGGYTVVLYDNNEQQLQNALNDINTKLLTLQKVNLLHGHTVKDVLGRISTSQDIGKAMKDAIYVQECIPENVELKKKLYSELDKIASPSTIIGSSTSSIPASKFTEHIKNRHRCLVAHPINPPHLIPLVEIIPAPWTDPKVVSKTKEIMINVGNSPIVLKKEIPGFVQNRLQYAILAEAFRLVEDGIVSPGDVDLAVVHGLASRWSFMGPFQTIDLNAPEGVEDYCNRYLDGIYSVLQKQDNNRRFSEKTIKTIDQWQRSLYRKNQIPETAAWRDQRLMALAVHHQEAKQIDRTMFPKL